MLISYIIEQKIEHMYMFVCVYFSFNLTRQFMEILIWAVGSTGTGSAQLARRVALSIHILSTV